jgi:hypothetical protein
MLRNVTWVGCNLDELVAAAESSSVESWRGGKMKREDIVEDV